jgi:23S rRNA (cytidine1920-2'-O)/16S rRNA (cytidine1409-2'-O)-methyltransferase
MIRLDLQVVQCGLASSRQRAKILITNQQIQVDGVICTKPAKLVEETAEIIRLGEDFRYVGRGGQKLEAVLEQQQLSLTHSVCMDIGASTGGFTDCMLQHGAEKVYAVDVGHGQLAENLRQDARVINLEGTDIRTLQREQIPDVIDFISVDVSFIALERILPDLCRFLSDTGTAVLLIKPQFEAGRADVGKNGIVKSKAVHIRVLKTVCMALEQQGLHIQLLRPSPIRGGSGNVEYLTMVKRGAHVTSVPFSPEQVVAQGLTIQKSEKK